MDFLLKLFGLKPKQKEIEIKIYELLDTLDASLSDDFKYFDGQVKNYFKEISKALIALDNESSNLQKMEVDESKETNPRLRKVIKTSKTELASQFKSIVKRLQTPKYNSIKSDFAVINTYCLSSTALIDAEVFNFRKNIAYASIVLAPEIKNLGEKLAELHKSILSLKEFANNQSKITKYFQITSAINEITKLNNDIKLANQKISFNQNNIKELNENKNELTKKIDSMQKDNEIEKFDKLNEKLVNLESDFNKAKNEILNQFNELHSLFAKLKSLQELKKFIISHEASEFLDKINSNLIKAIDDDINFTNLKLVFSELNKAIASDMLSLKLKEKEKKIAAIKNFNFYLLDDKLSHILEIKSDIESLKIEISDNDAKAKIISLAAELKQIDEKISKINSSNQPLIDENKLIEDKTKELIEKINNFSTYILNKKIIILV